MLITQLSTRRRLLKKKSKDILVADQFFFAIDVKFPFVCLTLCVFLLLCEMDLRSSVLVYVEWYLSVIFKIQV